VYEQGQVDRDARQLDEVRPDIPLRAVREQVSGLVELLFVVEPEGSASGIEVLVADPPGYGFEAEARKALQATRFAPAQLDGQPVRQRYRKAYEFTVQGGR